MPKQKNNIVMQNTQGMLGKQVVFKRRAGIGYVAAPPQVNEDRVPTKGQLAQQEKFADCSLYASEALTDEATKAAYQAAVKGGQSAYNVAFRDAATAPKIKALVTEGYRGSVGNIIVVQAKDDFKVTSLKVSIYNSANELIEEGNAVQNRKPSLWTYVVTLPNANVAGSTIKVTATDLPGNQGSLEVIL